MELAATSVGSASAGTLPTVIVRFAIHRRSIVQEASELGWLLLTAQASSILPEV